MPQEYPLSSLCLRVDTKGALARMRGGVLGFCRFWVVAAPQEMVRSAAVDVPDSPRLRFFRSASYSFEAPSGKINELSLDRHRVRFCAFVNRVPALRLLAWPQVACLTIKSQRPRTA